MKTTLLILCIVNDSQDIREFTFVCFSSKKEEYEDSDNSDCWFEVLPAGKAANLLFNICPKCELLQHDTII